MCDQRWCLQVFSFMPWNSQSRLCILPTTTSVSLSTDCQKRWVTTLAQTEWAHMWDVVLLVSAGQLQTETRVQFKNRPADGRRAKIMLLRERACWGVQGTAGGLCQQILAPFSSILLLSARMHDSLHLYRIIAGKWFKPNTGTLDHNTTTTHHFLHRSSTFTCKHEQKASPDSSWGSWVQMESGEKVTYSRWTFDTLSIRSLHKNTLNRSQADFLCHRGGRSTIHYRHLSL